MVMKKEFTSITKRHYKKTHEQVDNTALVVKEHEKSSVNGGS